MTTADIIEKCRNLQVAGYNVSFSVAHGETRVEHRDNESCELIAGFATRNADNSNLLSVIGIYLDSLRK